MKFKDSQIFTYGDDHIISFNLKDKITKKKFRTSKFKKDLEYHMRTKFGMVDKSDGMVLVHRKDFRVTYDQPIYKPGEYLKEGTRNLRPIKIKTYKTYGKIKNYDHNKGTTHRWNYHFKNKPSFLSYYWDENYKPIRPLKESVTRLVNPESTKITFEIHKAMLDSCLFDNIWNRHTVNHLYFYMMDLPYLEQNCFVTENKELKLRSDRKLCNMRNQYTQLYEIRREFNIVEPTQRQYLRRINTYVNENEVKELKIFNIQFKKKKEKAKRMYYKDIDDDEAEFWEIYKIRQKFNKLKPDEQEYIRIKYEMNDLNKLRPAMIDEVINLNSNQIVNRYFLNFYDSIESIGEKYKFPKLNHKIILNQLKNIQNRITSKTQKIMSQYLSLSTGVDRRTFIRNFNRYFVSKGFYKIDPELIF